MITIDCDNCGQEHTARHVHDDQYSDQPIYEAVCPKDGLSDFYTSEAAK